MAEPYCLAMTLCDAVHRDQTTGKFTILGTFSTLAAHQYPANISGCVYFAVTDGMGKVKMSIRIVESSEAFTDDESPVVFQTVQTEVDFESPLVVFEGAFLLLKIDNEGHPQPVILERPGMYHCELFANDALLMSRRLLALGPDEEVN